MLILPKLPSIIFNYYAKLFQIKEIPYLKFLVSLSVKISVICFKFKFLLSTQFDFRFFKALAYIHAAPYLF